MSPDAFLNDSKRLHSWQAAMPDFALLPVEKNRQIDDYLGFYGLDFSRVNKHIEHFLGYSRVGEEGIFLQFFRQTQAQDNKDYVLIIHGYTDHAGLFRHVIEKLLNSGKSVFIFDFPGHGLSSGERSDINSFDSYRSVLDHIIHLCLDMQEGNNKALHVVAQSMGAAVFMNWLIENRQQEKINTIILLAPLVRPLAWIQAKWGYRLLSPFVSSIKRTYSRNSQDENFLKRVRFEDPAQYQRTPVQWVGAMLRWVKYFENLPPCEVPVWVIQGTHDKTVDWQYNLKHIEKKFPKAKIRYVEGAGHHLANEAEYLRKKIFWFFDEAFAKA